MSEWNEEKLDHGTMIIHCGGRFINRDSPEMKACPAPKGRWHPIPHGEMLDIVEQGLGNAGMRISKQKYALSGQNDARFFGVMDIENMGTNDWGLALGLRNSTDKSFAAGLAAGERVFVCDNLGFSSELVVTRKHTQHILRDLPDLIVEALATVPDWVQARKLEVGEMKAARCQDWRAHDLVCKALRRGIIGTNDTKHVLTQWHEPDHQEFEDRTLWSLYNAFTSPKALGRRWEKQGGDNSLRSLKLNALLATAN